MNKPLVIVMAGIGCILLVCAAVYFIEPAKSLPMFFPGYSKALGKHHYTHAIGVLILAIGCFVVAWFQSGKNSPDKD